VLGNRYLRLGVGLGASLDLNSWNSYALGAPDYRLIIDRQPRLNGVASAVLAYSPTYYFRDLDGERNPTGESYLQHARYAALVSLNAVDLTNNLGFNRHLSLGLGAGRCLGDGRDVLNDMFISLFVELTYQRYLRDHYAAMEGKALPAFAAGTSASPAPPLNSLDPNDDHYFLSRPVYSIGFKLVYLISARPAPTLTPEQLKAARTRKDAPPAP